VFASQYKEGAGVFCVYFYGFKSGGEVEEFFHSSQNEEICGDLCRMVVFY